MKEERVSCPDIAERYYFPTVFISVLCFSVIFYVLVVFDLIPMGIPGQWVFPHVGPGYVFPLHEAIISLIIGAMILALSVRLGSDQALPKKVCRAGIFSLSVLGIFFDWNILLSGRIGFSENLYAVYDRYATGYLEVAENIESISDYIKGFHGAQEKSGMVNHINVHPPGRTVLSYLVLKTVYASPFLEDFLLRTMPTDASHAFKAIEDDNIFPYFDMDGKKKATGLLILYLFLFFLAAGKIFMAFVIWMLFGPRAALFSACFYMFCPSSILFFGHYDCFMSANAALLVLLAVCANRYDSIVLAYFSGFFACLSSLFSIAFGVPCLWILIYWFFCDLKDGGIRKFIFKRLLPFGIAYFFVIILLQLIFKFPYFNVLLSCLKNNDKFFQIQSTRTWIWKLLNYVEFMTAVGFPLMVMLFSCVIIKFGKILRKFREGMISHFDPVLIATFIIMMFLFFTPTRAEVSRQWSSAIPLMSLIFPYLFLSFKEQATKMFILCGSLLITQIIVFRFFIKIVIID
ncbi:MAG TPA: hypothetical protein PK821_05860 [Victivallales bacterium]|nr:hypothetical protein [Victivallales bacterium]